MRVLVTGATGFIGNYVIQELIKRNITVIATSRTEEKAKQFEWFDKVIYQSSDLSSTINFYEHFQEPTHLIHLAWEGLPNYKDLFHIERNLPHSYFFLKNILQQGLLNLTVIGTCFEYGMQSGCLAENLLTNPQNPYGIAKDTLRKYLELLQEKQIFQLKWVRLFYMYGKGQSEKSLLSQLDRALERGDADFNMSGGEQLRDYLPIEKVAEYIVKVALQDKTQGIINCCSGEPISVRKLVENHLQTKNQSIKLNLGYYPYPDFEPLAFWGNNTKINEIDRANTR